MTSVLAPAVFFDRDGVLNEDRGYVYRIEDLALPPDLGPGLQALVKAGLQLVVVSNQSGVARGYYGLEDVHAFNRALAKKIKDLWDVDFAAFYVCPHYPGGLIAEYAKDCACRKPGTKLLEDAAKDLGLNLQSSFLIGDKSSDIECALRAGVAGIQVRTSSIKDLPEYSEHPKAATVVSSVKLAAEWILKGSPLKS